MDQPKVYLLGAGLGDPDLLTRKAERVLRTVEAVLHDRQVSSQVLCLVNPEAHCIELSGGGSQEERQADVCGWYLRLREDCRSVVRLMVSDPLLAVETADELEFLARHGFDVEVLPGVLPETVYESRAAEREAQAVVREPKPLSR